MSRRLRLVAALAGLAGLVGLSGCNVSLQSLPKYSSLPGPFYEVHATFANVLNLPALAQVRSGVTTVGQVSSISAKNFEADVTLQIKTSERLPVGTRAEVQFSDPLGDEYVELIVPRAHPDGYLHDGSVLTEADTTVAPSVPDTLAALSTVLNGGGINQLHTIVNELNLTFNGNQSRIRDLFTEVQDSFGTLAAHKDDLDAALAALANVSRAVNAGTPTIVAGIDAIGPAVDELASQNSELDQLLTQVDQLAAVAGNMVSATSTQAVAAVDALKPVVDQLVAVDSQVGPALSAIGSFEAETPKVAPGNSLQVSLVATAVLDTTDTAGLDAALQQARSSLGTPEPVSGKDAVTALLQGGLS